MKSIIGVIVASVLGLLLVSCASRPETRSPQTSVPSREPAAAPPSEETFDPSTISKELYDSTKSDVQALIAELNTIIRDKQFESWVSYLSDSYRESLSSPDFLKKISESAILQKQKISLKTLEDYFLYVVVPSRTKDRVDDIEFMGQNRVKAFTINAKGQRLRLYDLEKTAGGWKIIN